LTKKRVYTIIKTMTIKPIKQIIAPPAPHWVGNGFYVNGFFHDFINDNSPFLLFDYAAPRYFGPSNIQRGVGQHPHKGFETVTIAIKGKVEHKDNHGNNGIIGKGDVQWMTAGSGIMHQEFLETEFNETGGEFSMVQLWVNLPAKEKLTKPKYQEILKSNIPVVNINGNLVSVIAGEFQAAQGPANTFSPINMYTLDLVSDLGFSFPEEFTTMILVLEGSAQVNDSNIPVNHLVTFEKTGETVECKTDSKAKLLVLSAEPLNEPIAHYGPFVMNTQREIMEAIDDFNAGKFGEMV
jgi:quercetin 2,3-dioxygenase